MSKLYKDLKYDTDRVMQPGDPLTSPDGSTAIKAINTGKGFIETYGDAIDHYYDVTVDIPQVSGASARVRLKGVDNTTIDVEILSIDGFSGASINSSSPWQIQVNGSYWGSIQCNPAWEGSTYPDYAIIPIGFGGRICVDVNPTSADSDYCHWSNLEQTRQLVSSKEIITAAEEAANKVLASPSTGSSGTIAFRSLVAADIPNLNTSKLTAGTLGVARGGTGKSSHTINSVIIGGTSTTGALQNVASASGAFYSTGTNVRPQFGTLPVAQGGTGVNGSSQAINKVLASPASGSAGAISFRSLTVADLPTGTTSSTVALGNHTHSDYVSKTVTGNNQAIQTGLSIATDKSISMGGETGKGNIVLCAATNTANTYLLVGSTDGEYIYIEKDKFGYTSDGEQTASMLKFPPASTEVKTIATTNDLNILPITSSTVLSITMTADKYMYKVTDSGATGTFPTLTAPTGLPASCYYKFELEWVTASPTATYAQTASTTPAMKWISSPVMQTDGLTHTYHISGRYDTTTSTFWMSCWKIDDAQGAITPDSHTMKYLLTTPAQVVSTTTNANDTITVQLSDHAINTVQVPTTATNVVMKFPGQAVGKARDFMVRLVVTGETVPSITLTEPDGSAVEFDVDDDSWTEIEQGVNLLMFTETAQ